MLSSNEKPFEDDEELEKLKVKHALRITKPRHSLLFSLTMDSEMSESDARDVARSNPFVMEEMLKLEEEMMHEQDGALLFLRYLNSTSRPLYYSLFLAFLFELFLFTLSQIPATSSTFKIDFPYSTNPYMYNTGGTPQQSQARRVPFRLIDGDKCYSITCGMTDDGFLTLQHLVLSAVAIGSGLGMEVFFGHMLLKLPNHVGVEWLWIYANLLFPLLILLAAGAGSLWGVLFGIVGMYKFGFPETTAFLVRGFNSPLNSLQTYADLANGFGLLLHHSSSMVYIVGANLGIYYPSRHFLIIPIPLCLQHATTILRYVSPTVYPIVQFFLEIWFEVECFSIFNAITQFTQPYLCWTMLVAHWLFWLAALLDVCAHSLAGKLEEEGEGEMNFLRAATTRLGKRHANALNGLAADRERTHQAVKKMAGKYRLDLDNMLSMDDVSMDTTHLLTPLLSRHSAASPSLCDYLMPTPKFNQRLLEIELPVVLKNNWEEAKPEKEGGRDTKKAVE